MAAGGALAEAQASRAGANVVAMPRGRSILALDLVERTDPVPADASLLATVETFRRFPDARFLAVVDADGRPRGAICERSVRALLFGPFGHALLGNPGCPWQLSQLIEACPVGDIDAPTEILLESFAASPDSEGMIMLRHGRYAGLLPAMALLRLAAEREREAHRRQLEQAEAVVERGRALQRAFDGFRSDAISFGEALVAAAQEIKLSAFGIAERAQRNGAQAAAVAATSGQSARGMKKIADSSAALALRVRGIDEQVGRSKAAVSHVVAQVEANEGKTRSLSAAADEIGDVVALISAIAAQVNLLAINARIEAARAGDAGTGFAVVASEVKSLSHQVGEAANQIASKAESIRVAAAETAAANGAIGEIVHGLDEVAAYIADAIGHQSSATETIARNVEEAAAASVEISAHVAEMGERAGKAGALSERMRDVADGLTGKADQLRVRVGLFLEELAV